MQREIDMAPYGEQFTKLERLFFERMSVMNIVAYMADRQFSEAQYKRVFGDYVEINKTYEKYLKEFENKVLIPLIEGPFHWEADFERGVVYVS